MKASDLIQWRMKRAFSACPPCSSLPPCLASLACPSPAPLPPPTYPPIHMEPLYELPPLPTPAEPAEACIIHLSMGTYPPCQTPPTGTILINNTGLTPSGYLPCDGSTVSRATYSALFQVIGEYYGEGNNTTTFHLPQLSNTAQPTVGYIIKT
jgi:hypothetical protein